MFLFGYGKLPTTKGIQTYLILISSGYCTWQFFWKIRMISRDAKSAFSYYKVQFEPYPRTVEAVVNR